MMASDFDQDSSQRLPRRIPAILTYLKPYRLIGADEDEIWSSSVEQINSRTWDYIKLHEITGGLDVGLKEPFHLVVGFDGALALPPLNLFRETGEAVEFFNRICGSILLGGIYCEAINADDIEIGSILDWTYIRSQSTGRSLSATFHSLFRMRMAPPLLAMQLHQPPTLKFSELRTAADVGMNILGRVPELRAEFLLKGATSLARQDPGSALANLWIVVEQLTQGLWDREVIGQSRNKIVAGRKKQLEDNRTWSTGPKHELMLRIGLINDLTFSALFTARKARNDLAHTGRHPSSDEAQAAYDGVIGLLKAGPAKRYDLPLLKLDLSNSSLSDPLRPDPSLPSEPTHWMPIPKLPGEEEIERSERAANDPETRARARLGAKPLVPKPSK